METAPKILAFSGSLRDGSFNKKLLRAAIKGAKEAGAEVTLLDLAEYPLPIYNGDIEAKGIPENVLKLKKLLWENQGLLIASPEYNSSFSGALKNMIDWTTRITEEKEVYLSCYIDKAAALMSASTGSLGGLRGLVHLRAVLENIHTIVIPAQRCLSNASEAFDDSGNLKSATDQKMFEDLGKKLSGLLIKLHRDDVKEFDSVSANT